ncbi:MAG: cryptochrome/photolyase family protein [Janthinobacterium lividum]
MPAFDQGLVWFRRDLRIADHAALYHALTQCRRVLCLFVFDSDILHDLPDSDRRVAFIHAALHELDERLGEAGSALIVRHGQALEMVLDTARRAPVQAVFANRDYEPATLARDHAVGDALAAHGIALFTFKDQVIFEQDEVLSAQNEPYTVYSPYKRKWLSQAGPAAFSPYPVEDHLHALTAVPRSLAHKLPPLKKLGFGHAQAPGVPTGERGALVLLDDFVARIGHYAKAREIPSVKGSSLLSVHLRHGTLSIRAAARAAWARLHDHAEAGGAEVWLSELAWRDFFFNVLFHHPRVGQPGAHRAFREEFDRIEWASGKTADAHFKAWCAGQTGYPLVDAAMRQINTTGYMHNRLRMVVASFLCKDLGLDWRLGEAYFERELNDFDLSANNGNWQWAASTGCDAQPYFRIFNPLTQSTRFDAEGTFIRAFVPELARLPAKAIHAPWLAKPEVLQAAGLTLGADYPLPIVDHAVAREQALQRYAAARQRVA